MQNWNNAKRRKIKVWEISNETYFNKISGKIFCWTGPRRISTTMIGAMPAVAVRHERRKNKTKEKPVRPSRLQVSDLFYE